MAWSFHRNRSILSGAGSRLSSQFPAAPVTMATAHDACSLGDSAGQRSYPKPTSTKTGPSESWRGEMLAQNLPPDALPRATSP